MALNPDVGCIAVQPCPSHSVLLIQGDPSAAKIVREALRDSTGVHFNVELLQCCSDGVERLTRSSEGTARIDAVLAELNLRDSSGIATFDRLFQVASHIPILVITDLVDEAVARQAVKRGAQDYLLKDHLDSYLLPKTVESMIERALITEALYQEKERAQVTLNSIGDAVMSSDRSGNVTYLNIVSERLTGWSGAQAFGQPLEKVFRIIDATTREEIPNPMALAMQENRTVALTPNCLLVRRDGIETAIEDSAAPIHDRYGQVVGAVMVFHDVSAARAMLLRMSYLARHDSLTDLPNRIMLNDRLAQAMAMADRQRGRIAILYMDLDRFKFTNDTLGHGVGDALLKAVADRLRECVRSSDTVSRQGGDEFVVMLPQVNDAQHAELIARKIMLALRAPYLIEGKELHFTVSIGIAMYPEDGTNIDTLLKNADFAMYQAKDGGRDDCQFYKAELNVRAVERHAVETCLRRALAQQEFVLHYQPTINLQSGKVAGVEALLRWHRPQHGLVMPAEFIPVAEETGLIVPIGRWVLMEACRQAREWEAAGGVPVRVAVNISAVELRASDFVPAVKSILQETGLKPELLELELTETFLMQDEIVTDVTLRALSDMGVRLALDDFGTGYSSLSYARRLPINCLKIDQSFVRNLGVDGSSDDASIISAVVHMGMSLHMRVVAEGVETAAQLAYLKEQGCPEAQGYYFSRPLPHGEMAQLLGCGPAAGAALQLARIAALPAAGTPAPARPPSAPRRSRSSR